MDANKIISDFSNVTGYALLLVAQSSLLNRILKGQDCNGISGKTQKLYAIIFGTRFIRIVFMKSRGFLRVNPLLELIMTGIFLVLSCVLVHSIFRKFSETYREEDDNFRINLVIVPSAIFSMAASFFDVFLESVAILPQLFMIARQKRVEPHVRRYITVLAISRLMLLIGYQLCHRDVPTEKFWRDMNNAAGMVQLFFYFQLFITDVPIVGKYETFWTRRRVQQNNNVINDFESAYDKVKEPVDTSLSQQKQQSFKDASPPAYEAAVIHIPATITGPETMSCNPIARPSG